MHRLAPEPERSMTGAKPWSKTMTMRSLVPVALLFSAVALGEFHEVHGVSFNPKPSPKSVVVVGRARFTLLSEHLVRMEWGGVNDNATFTFLNRNTLTPTYNVSQESGWTVIRTPALTVRYLPSNVTFSAANLEVSLMLGGKPVVWRPVPGVNATLNGNLLGTLRTLDGVDGSIELNCHNQSRADLHCQLGLVSTAGYVVVDDTHRPQFDSSPWPWVVNKTYPQPSPALCAKATPDQRLDCGYPGISDYDCTGKGCCVDSGAGNGVPGCFYAQDSYLDLYFFGHGHDYKLALKEFTLVAGRIPIPPRYAFGIFYSRYWAYNDVGEMEVVRGYEEHDIPLDVLVTDMDWHVTFYKEADGGKKDQAGQTVGWTGFTWDKHLFPDPKAFLDWCKTKGLKNTLNLHPASGIQPWEDKYSEMALAMGIDPKTQKYVPFAPTDPKFTNNWLTIVLGARESEGIDFWWLDWQQNEEWIKIPLVNPTFWLNYIFFTTPYHWRNNTVRPFLLHRWGGLGNHRYQVGFSGDVVPSWASLHFQVFFTLRATNVLFGYWSHDLGGHILPSPPELYTRWVQWGVFSPMFRTHCTKNPLNFRRIWLYPDVNYEIMRRAIILRASLVPYIYTNARFAHDEGLSLLRPMYYEFPESPEAYSFDHQYFFGSDLLVSPVTQALDESTQLVTKDIWIPEGTYISWFSGEMLTGPQTVTRSFALWEIPVYARDGAIIPMRTDGFGTVGTTQDIPQSLKFVVFIGNMKMSSRYVYEDDGSTMEYETGKFSNTTVSYTWNSDQSTLLMTVGPASGSFSGMPSTRGYQICIPNFWPADVVMVGTSELPYSPLLTSFADYSHDSWTYNGRTLSLMINIVTPQSVTAKTEVVVKYTSFKNFNPYSVPSYAGMLGRLENVKQTLDNQWDSGRVYQEDYFSLLNATEMGQKITHRPGDVVTLAQQFSSFLSTGIDEVKALGILSSAVKTQVLSMLTLP